MLLQHAFIAENQRELETAGQAFSTFYNYFGAWFKNERPISQGRIATLSQEEIAQNEMMSAHNLTQNLLIGEIGQVVERLKSYQAMGYDEYALWLDNGLPFDVKQQQLKRFIDQVLPHF